MNLAFTRCQDRSCPKAGACQRFDPAFSEDPKQAYFARSPRVRDECGYFAPFNGELKPKPLTSDWPVDDQ
jgi:hypothetical protein